MSQCKHGAVIWADCNLCKNERITELEANLQLSADLIKAAKKIMAAQAVDLTSAVAQGDNQKLVLTGGVFVDGDVLAEGFKED